MVSIPVYKLGTTVTSTQELCSKVTTTKAFTFFSFLLTLRLSRMNGAKRACQLSTHSGLIAYIASALGRSRSNQADSEISTQNRVKPRHSYESCRYEGTVLACPSCRSVGPGYNQVNILHLSATIRSSHRRSAIMLTHRSHSRTDLR